MSEEFLLSRTMMKGACNSKMSRFPIVITIIVIIGSVSCIGTVQSLKSNQFGVANTPKVPVAAHRILQNYVNPIRNQQAP